MINRNAKRNASIVTDFGLQETELVVITREVYSRSAVNVHKKELDEKVLLLRECDAFNHWHLPQLMRIAYCLKKKVLPRNAVVLEKDKPVHYIFLIKTGELKEVQRMVLDTPGQHLESPYKRQIRSHINVDIALFGPGELIISSSLLDVHSNRNISGASKAAQRAALQQLLRSNPTATNTVITHTRASVFVLEVKDFLRR